MGFGGKGRRRIDGILRLAANGTRGGFRIGEVEIADDDFISVENQAMYESIAGETVGNAFTVMIEETIKFKNEVIEIGNGRLR